MTSNRTNADSYTRALAALQAQAAAALCLFPLDDDGNRREIPKAERRRIRARLRAAQSIMSELQSECRTIYRIVREHGVSVVSLDAAALETLLARE